MQHRQDAPILIAGAGVGGLALAVGLQRFHLPVEVFELRDEPVSGDGTALNLWGNAVTALDQLAVGEAIRDIGHPIRRTQIWSARGQLVTGTDVEEIGRQLGTSSLNIRRSDLTRLLYDSRGEVPVHTGTSCAGYRVEDEGITLVLEGGEEVRGRALVGADGVRSAIRAQLVADGDPSSIGFPVWRGISDMDGGLTSGIAFLVWGSQGGGAGAWHVDDQHVSWTVGTNTGFQRRHGALVDKDRNDAKDALLGFVDAFPGPFSEVISGTPSERMFASSLLIRKKADVWGEGPVTLLGDAAHAMPTAMGQGACQALEDAVVLSHNLATSPDAVSALRRYESQRKPRIRWVRDKVFMYDRFQRWENPALCTLRNVIVRHTPSRSNRRTMRRMLAFNA